MNTPSFLFMTFTITIIQIAFFSTESLLFPTFLLRKYSRLFWLTQEWSCFYSCYLLKNVMIEVQCDWLACFFIYLYRGSYIERVLSNFVVYLKTVWLFWITLEAKKPISENKEDRREQYRKGERKSEENKGEEEKILGIYLCQ